MAAFGLQRGGLKNAVGKPGVVPVAPNWVCPRNHGHTRVTPLTGVGLAPFRFAESSFRLFFFIFFSFFRDGSASLQPVTAEAYGLAQGMWPTHALTHTHTHTTTQAYTLHHWRFRFRSCASRPSSVRSRYAHRCSTQQRKKLGSRGRESGVVCLSPFLCCRPNRHLLDAL